MRVLDNKKSMTAFRIKLVRDFNEVWIWEVVEVRWCAGSDF